MIVSSLLVRTMLAPQTTEPLLSCDHLSMHYENRSALRDVSLAIYPGETLSLLGPNGAGKSTLLKLIAGMMAPSHGHLAYERPSPVKTEPFVTYVPQRNEADWSFPISVLECTLLGLSRVRSRWSAFSKSDTERALETLRLVRMDHFAHTQIGALSGGQQQRVFLARALLNQGQVLLLDEPFTGVDVPTQDMLVEIFRDLNADGIAIVYATHDLVQAARSSDRAALLNGELIAIGPPRDVLTGPNLSATFGGTMLTSDLLRDMQR